MHNEIKVIVLVSLICNAALLASDITKRSAEFDLSKDGEIDLIYESVYRGKEKIYELVLEKSEKSEGFARKSQSFFVGKTLAFTEIDENLDGFFELLVVYNSGNEVEVFTRHRDGNICPVDSETLAAYKKRQDAISQLWDNILPEEGRVNPEKGMKLIERTRRQLAEPIEP